MAFSSMPSNPQTKKDKFIFDPVGAVSNRTDRRWKVTTLIFLIFMSVPSLCKSQTLPPVPIFIDSTLNVVDTYITNSKQQWGVSDAVQFYSRE